MKLLRLLLISFFLVVFTACFCSISAVELSLETEIISEERLKSISENVEISVLYSAPVEYSICCFDVNEDGLIALGFTGLGDAKYIGVYDREGVFQYGYKYETSGSYGIELEKNILKIYSVRGDIRISVNQSGEICEIVGIKQSYENSLYWRKAVDANIRKVGNETYIIRNNMGVLNLIASSYSQLIRINEDGSIDVLYDITDVQIAKTLMILLVFVLIAFICIYTVFGKVKKFIKKQNEQPSPTKTH